MLPVTCARDLPFPHPGFIILPLLGLVNVLLFFVAWQSIALLPWDFGASPFQPVRDLVRVNHHSKTVDKVCDFIDFSLFFLH
jgi:hypothetical protein